MAVSGNSSRILSLLHSYQRKTSGETKIDQRQPSRDGKAIYLSRLSNLQLGSWGNVFSFFGCSCLLEMRLDSFKFMSSSWRFCLLGTLFGFILSSVLTRHLPTWDFRGYLMPFSWMLFRFGKMLRSLCKGKERDSERIRREGKHKGRRKSRNSDSS